MTRVGVVVFPGSNCEHDAVEAIRVLGGDADLLWHGGRSVDGFDAVVDDQVAVVLHEQAGTGMARRLAIP